MRLRNMIMMVVDSENLYFLRRFFLIHLIQMADEEQIEYGERGYDEDLISFHLKHCHCQTNVYFTQVLLPVLFISVLAR